MVIEVTASLRHAMAPIGTLRAGLNLGNPLLINQDSVKTPPLSGIVIDLAHELGRRLGLPVELIGYPAPGKLADAAKTGAWDIAFLAHEAERAQDIDFTAAYVEIEATYLLPPGSPIRSLADVDRPGVRIALSGKSAYDLYLTRTIRHATLLRANGAEASFELFRAEKCAAVAGLRPALVGYARKLPGAQVLTERFTAVQQAIGTPRGRGPAADYLRAFAEEIKSSGLVARLIAKHGVDGLTVAPPA